MPRYGRLELVNVLGIDVSEEEGGVHHLAISHGCLGHFEDFHHHGFPVGRYLPLLVRFIAAEAI